MTTAHDDEDRQQRASAARRSIPLPQRREQAQEFYRESRNAGAGMPMTHEELAAAFGTGPKWARQQIEQVHEDELSQELERETNARLARTNTPLPTRIRWAVRCALVLGVAAYILHAADDPISQAIIASWPPLVLLLAIKLIFRIPDHTIRLAHARLVAIAATAGIAMWLSCWHVIVLVPRFGEAEASLYLIPLTVDELVVVVALICLVELTARIRFLRTPDDQ